MSSRRSGIFAGGQHGLTLIEIIVVLLIFALGWFTLLPALSPSQDQEDGRELKEANELLLQARQAAMSKGVIQHLAVTRDKGVIQWGEQSAQLPSSVSNWRVNGRTLLLSKTRFKIYPSGAMDELRLNLANGAVATSSPLLATLTLQ